MTPDLNATRTTAPEVAVTLDDCGPRGEGCA